MRKAVIWALIAIAVAAVAVFVFTDHQPDPKDILNFEGPRMVALIALLIVFVASMIASRPALGEVTRAALIWGGLALVLVALYAFRAELETVARRTLAVLVPGMTVAQSDGSGAVMVARSGDNHFRVTARVDGTNIDFLVDTGASTIVLTYDDARAAGIDAGSLVFSIPVATANGTALVAPVKLGRIHLGDTISATDVPAFVAAKKALNTSLLGMTFLSSLSSWEMRGDRLILRP